MAPSTRSARMTAPRGAARFWKKAVKKERSGPCRTGPTMTGMATSAGMTDLGIEDAVEEVDADIDQDHDAGNQKNAALQARVVAPGDRFDQPAPDPRPGIDVLGEHRAGE